MILKQKKINLIAAAVIILFTVRMVIAQNQNTLKDPALKEISGIAASHINKNILYVHNDSGDTSRFFAITPTGQLKETFYFKADEANKNVVDCEDIAVSVGPEKGKSYVYLGDIGDNGAQRQSITIYRFNEPVVTGTPPVSSIKTNAIHLKYPDGAHDAETLMVDPVDRLFYIITKREDSVGVYTAPLNAPLDETTVLQKKAKLYFPGLPLFRWITAGDISADGSKILVRSYQKVFYWKRQPGEPIWKTLERKPAQLPYKAEKQGEAIGFTLNGKGYYTTSEGKNAPIYYYQTPK
ncbi:hypothetical protein [Mucilaginibacter arboris]|uniref:PE-PGRS family protein n=1 Tax=Mucilaginibacter arboris TaxID=2682090 RepID=A0A7K1SY06_9SPHI|nr:hypothetical protein [Mucilaginibacter arboris]MVN22138.1 hypothetical protein [Mucilaginibacter arboris]